MARPAPETASIAAGVIAAFGASTCCVLPLVLVTIGVGGAWVAQVRQLERFYFVFVAIAVAAFGYAFYRLYFRASECAPADAACALPVVRNRQRIAFWTTLIVAKALLLFPVYGPHLLG